MGGPRIRELKLPRKNLPEPLANCLRLFGFNWRGRRSKNGTLWTVYRYGKPATPPDNSFILHSDDDPDKLLRWCQHYEKLGPRALLREIGRMP